MKKITGASVVLLISLRAIEAHACSYFPMPLLQLVEYGNTDHIINFRVTAYEDVDQGFPKYMEGEVVQQLRGKIEETSIRIYGGDGLSCQPYVSEFSLNQEWLLPLSESDGVYRLSPFTQPIAIADNVATGFISTLNCPANAEGNLSCRTLSQDDYTAVLAEQMTLTELERALKLHSNGVAWALELCKGPSTSCENIRPVFNPENGILELPAVDVLSTPFTYGRSATLQLIDSEESTFKVVEIK